MAPPLLLLFLLLSSIPLVRPDQNADKATLLAFRAAVGPSVLSWNTSNAPCSWKGVICESGNVTVLRFPGVGLIGRIPVGIFGNLTGLRTLSLRFNALSGPLPSDLSACVELRNVFLGNNKFSGGINPILGLPNLVRLNLADNQFSGEIPAGLNNLTRLATLFLENNNFSGSIPDLDKLILQQFNVSYNKLSGSVPRSLRLQKADSFLGMSLCGGPLEACPGEETPSPSPSGEPGDGKNKLSGGAIAGIVIGCVVGFLIILGLIYFFCCVKRSKPQSVAVERGTGMAPVDSAGRAKQGGIAEDIGGAAPRSANNVPASTTPAAALAARGVGKKLIMFGRKPEKVYDLEDLLRASAEVLGKGAFGTSYKAILEVGAVVAVKRLRDVDVLEAEFREKIEAVGGMHHPNLVLLRAYYYSKDEQLLVYDYMPNGSLSALIHGNRGASRTPLAWETRLTIAADAARGIHYIHSVSATHGNIKSSNVLLAEDYKACISDQGLNQLGPPSVSPNRVASYRAPEVTDSRRVSQKADVYSFGILLLELLTGKAPAQPLLNDEGVDLPRWVKSIKQEDWSGEVFDLELLRYQNDEMPQLLDLAMECAEQYPDNRPTMSDVVSRIESMQNKL